MRWMLGGYATPARDVIKQKLCFRLKGSICVQVAAR
jgi:hypothetical protein